MKQHSRARPDVDFDFDRSPMIQVRGSVIASRCRVLLYPELDGAAGLAETDVEAGNAQLSRATALHGHRLLRRPKRRHDHHCGPENPRNVAEESP
jgi:hypothetical protein